MTHVCFVLHPQFQMLAYVLASETLRIANRRAGQALFTWETRSATSMAVKASNGRHVAPDIIGWADTTAPQLVLIVAGYDPLAVCPSGLAAYLGRANGRGTVLGGIDTGVSILAHFGLLAPGQRVVMHHEARAAFSEQWPDYDIVDAMYVIDGKRLSTAGGTATGDALLVWIADQVSATFAAAVANDMAHGSIRQARLDRISDASSKTLVARMRRLMAAHVEASISIAEIAKRLGLSVKALRARCVRELGRTPSEVYLDLRLELASDLLGSTDLPVTTISLATGFGSLAGFSRTFRQAFGHAPSLHRRMLLKRPSERLASSGSQESRRRANLRR